MQAYIKINKENVMLTTMKTAEANGDGMIVRFCEIGGENTENVCVQLPSSVSSYTETDIIENNIGKPVNGNVICFDIPAYRFKTFRILTGNTLAKVTGVKAVCCESADRSLESTTNEKQQRKIYGTNITWDYVDGASYYEVFRIRGDSKPMFLFATEKNTYFDTQVGTKISDKYCYVIRACASGRKGEFSEEIKAQEAELCNILPPEKPVLQAVSREKQRIDLFWTPAKANALLSHYEIYRNGEKIATTTDAYVCTYRDRTVNFGKTYTYSVAAVNKFGDKSVSEAVVLPHTSDIFAHADSKIAKKKHKSLYSLLMFKK